MRIKDLLSQANIILKKKKINSAFLDAELLLSFVLNEPKEYLYTYPNAKLNKKLTTKYFNLIKKRANNYPIAYILGYKEFYGLKFLVNKNVLIPRPETELLVDATFEVANFQSRIVEIGTGSGCISISLVKNGIHNIIATDVSKKALNIARKNARFHKILSKIQFIKSNLLNKLKNKKIDIIIANLPYLSNKYQKERSIKNEPKLALFSDKSGLKHYQNLFIQISQLKHKVQYVLIELNPEQIKNLSIYIKQIFPQVQIKLKKDLQGLNRIMIIKLI